MKPAKPPDNFATVGRFYHPTDAQIAAGRLRSEGIPILMPEINHVTANWLLATALGGIRVQVPSQYVTIAEDILREADLASASEKECCPRCDGTNTRIQDNGWKVAFLAIHLFSLPLPWKNSSHRCLDCKAEWPSQVDD